NVNQASYFRISTTTSTGDVFVIGPNGQTSIGPLSPSVAFNPPLSMLDILGGVAVGSYAGTAPAPTNGLIVSGSVGIGTSSPASTLSVNGSMDVSSMRVGTICDSAGANCKTVSTGWGSGGSVTTVATGTGMMGGPITTSGTISVDVGTTANKILQMS